MIQATGPGTKSAQFTHSYLLILQMSPFIDVKTTHEKDALGSEALACAVRCSMS